MTTVEQRNLFPHPDFVFQLSPDRQCFIENTQACQA